MKIRSLHWRPRDERRSAPLLSSPHVTSCHVTFGGLEEDIMSNDHINNGVLLKYLPHSPIQNAKEKFCYKIRIN